MSVYKSALIGVLVYLSAASSFAMPTQKEAYRNEALGISLYKDSDEAGVYWYLPYIKPYAENNKLVYREKAKKDGKVTYTFYLMPYLQEDMVKVLANEVPDMTTPPKAVVIKKIALQIKDFNVLSTSDEATNRIYINKPQMLRFDLDKDQSEDFQELFSASPGVPVNIVLYYDAEKVDKSIKIELSYKEVFNAMGIGVSGRYVFTGAEIEAGVQKYLANKYLNITTKGKDVKIPDIVAKVISDCFTPMAMNGDPNYNNGNGWGNNGWGNNNSNNGWGSGNGWGTDNGWNNNTGSGNAPNPTPNVWPSPTVDLPKFLGSARSGISSELSQLAQMENGLRQRGLMPQSQYDDPPIYNNGPAGLEFKFRKELRNRDEKFLFTQTELQDSSEIAVVPTYLMKAYNEDPSRIVTPLETKTVLVGNTATKNAPTRSAVKVNPGDQWTITSAFTLSAKSGLSANNEFYRWDNAWPSPDGDLYYRVGDGPWRKVGGRTVVGMSNVQSGELQFYMDRAALWEKIPEKLTKHWLTSIFEYKNTFPEFTVTLSGRHVQTK